MNDVRRPKEKERLRDGVCVDDAKDVVEEGLIFVDARCARKLCHRVHRVRVTIRHALARGVVQPTRWFFVVEEINDLICIAWARLRSIIRTDSRGPVVVVVVEVEERGVVATALGGVIPRRHPAIPFTREMSAVPSAALQHCCHARHVSCDTREASVWIIGRIYIVPHHGLVVLDVDVDRVAARLYRRACWRAEFKGVVIVELHAIRDER